MNPGTVIGSRYELGERLGLGGMSTVNLAFDRRLEREVAIKLLAEHLAHDEQFVSRFRREALAAARLVHPNVVQVFDFGLDETTGRHFIVMEHIAGASMAEILTRRGHLPPDEVLEIVRQACRGLDYAHRNGVVHRDVKPGNLLRAESDGTIKLADFGIAKALSDESSITQVGSVLGTAAYLAPEQAAGEEVGPRADIYALGVVTYQLLSGRLPYEAQSLTELALKQQRETPPLLSDIVDGVPMPVARAVDRALALDPRDRYPTADALAEALAQGHAGVAPTAATSVSSEDETSVTRVVPRGGTEEWDAPATGAVRARTPRPARQAPAPVPAGPPAGRRAQRLAEPAPAPQRRRGGGGRRLAGLLLVLLLIAAGVAIAYLATSTSGDAVELRRVVYEDAGRIIDELEGLIRDNTE